MELVRFISQDSTHMAAVQWDRRHREGLAREGMMTAAQSPPIPNAKLTER